MVGAKHLACDENSMSCKIMRNSKGVTHIKVFHTAMDLYDITFFNCRNYQVKEVEKIEGIYNDMLRATFEKYTGLNTSL
jgi:hypothetical protein